MNFLTSIFPGIGTSEISEGAEQGNFLQDIRNVLGSGAGKGALLGGIVGGLGGKQGVSNMASLGLLKQLGGSAFGGGVGGMFTGQEGDLSSLSDEDLQTILQMIKDRGTSNG